MKAIQKELGDSEDLDDISEIETKLKEINLTKEAQEKCKSETEKKIKID